MMLAKVRQPRWSQPTVTDASVEARGFGFFPAWSVGVGGAAGAAGVVAGAGAAGDVL